MTEMYEACHHGVSLSQPCPACNASAATRRVAAKDQTRHSPIPWTAKPEDYSGSRAYSLFDAQGDRIAVGLLREDALFIIGMVYSDVP